MLKIERIPLSLAQILNIVLSTDDLVGDLEARAKENKQRAMSQAHKNNPNNQKNNSLDSKEPQLLKPQNTNEELGKIAYKLPTLKYFKSFKLQ